VSPVIVSSASLFEPAFTYPLELTPGDLFHVALHYAASNQTLVTTMTRNGAPFGPIKDVRLGAEFGDFRVNAVSVSSYSDAGDRFGSVFAQGVVDNVVVTMPEPPVGRVTGAFGNSGWQVCFASRSNWHYTLERSLDCVNWNSASSPVPGTGGELVLLDNQAPAGTAALFHRVKADRP
jgi:hypothetical protein